MCKEIVRSLPKPLPDDPAALLEAICAHYTAKRGQRVRLMLPAFPPGTVSGLWIKVVEENGAQEDLICVERNTSPSHQLVILGHELYHMMMGNGDSSCTTHSGGAATARMRMLSSDLDVNDAVKLVEAATAARTDVDAGDEEAWAERCGLAMATALRTALETAGPSSGVAGRIHRSLES
ncbi:toxin-antitoxin system, toxin component [Streptomyces sp. NPDC127110]|uniref:toxin-antitoxin system, toxin component n=1 Tax=Streptomyces sp. NPDC127110 TaxID=3345362 RepID=UPI00364480F5